MAKRMKRGKINSRQMAGVGAAFAAIAWAVEYNFRNTQSTSWSGRASVPSRALAYGGLGLLAGVLASKYDPSLGAGLMLGGALAAGSVAVVSPETTNPQLTSGSDSAPAPSSNQPSSSGGQ